MTPRSSSPGGPESLLWKGRFLRDYKTLLNHNIELKAQVKALTTRVVAAEDAAKNVKTLSDRLAALEQDDDEQRDLFTRLDDDRAKRIRELEMKDAGYNSKLDRMAKKVQDLQVDIDDLTDKRDESASQVNGEEVQAIKAALEKLDDKLSKLETQHRYEYESNIGETAGLRRVFMGLEKRVDELEAKPADVVTPAAVPLQGLSEAINQVHEMTRSIMNFIPPTTQVAISKPSNAAAKKPSGPRKAPAPRRIAASKKPQVSVSASMLTESPSASTESNEGAIKASRTTNPAPAQNVTPVATQKPRRAAAPAAKRSLVPQNTLEAPKPAALASHATTPAAPVSSRTRPPKRVVKPTAEANLKRRRSTRWGHRDSQILSRANYDANAVKIVGDADDEIAAGRKNLRPSIKRPLSAVNEEDSDLSSLSATRDSEPTPKRARRASAEVPEAAESPSGPARGRMFPNLKVSADAGDARAAVMPGTVVRTDPTGAVRSDEIEHVSKEPDLRDELPSEVVNNLFEAVANNLQQIASTSSAQPRPIRRKAARMPALPPTPPTRDGRIMWDMDDSS